MGTGWGGGEMEGSVAMIAMAAAALVCAVAVVALAFTIRRTRLNWYEKSVVEMSKGAEAEYIRYRHRSDPEIAALDLDKDDTPKLSRTKQQSRIYKQPPKAPRMQAMGIPENMSEKFVVPKSRSCTGSISMFHNLDKAQLNRELYDIRQDSSASEEQVVGECGSLKMALGFDPRLSLLSVSLRQAAELMALREDAPPNPYFKVTLQKPEPEAHPFTQQSKIYKGIREPELTDDFFFDVGSSAVSACKLEVLVMDYDPCCVDECIGYCWLTLGRLDIPAAPDPPTVFWAEILPNDTFHDAYGEILISVAYLAKAQRLTISVFKARKLVQPSDMLCQPDPSVRVTVNCEGKRLKRKKTCTKRGTVHPQFNEALTFSLPKTSVVSIVVEVEVLHEVGPLSTPRPLGTLTLPLSKCKDLWRALIRGDSTQARWYPLEKPLEKEKQSA